MCASLGSEIIEIIEREKPVCVFVSMCVYIKTVCS